MTVQLACPSCDRRTVGWVDEDGVAALDGATQCGTCGVGLCQECDQVRCADCADWFCPDCTWRHGDERVCAPCYRSRLRVEMAERIGSGGDAMGAEEAATLAASMVQALAEVVRAS